MLKTSPIISTSNNASPTSFRRSHATSRSPHGSPRPSSASRGQSVATASMTSSPNIIANSPRPQRLPAYTASVEAATSAGQPAPTSSSDSSAAQAVSNSSSAPVPPVTQPDPNSVAESQAMKDVLSPNKRRVSTDLLAGGGGAQTARDSPEPAATSKRARTDAQPPKVLPQRYELCAVEDIVELIAHMLAELIATNDAIMSSGSLTRFHSRTAPGISVRDYLHRLARHATLTPPLLLAMVYYIDRLCAMYAEFTINTLTVHRFLITAAAVASKGLSDSFWNNTTYARVGGVRLQELKLLELELLYRVDWKIVPNPEVLVAYYKGLVERTPEYVLEDGDSSEDDNDLDLSDDEQR